MIQTVTRLVSLKLKTVSSQQKLLSFPVYRSLDQVLGILNSRKVSKFEEVQQLLNVACEKNLVTKLPDGSYGKSPLFSQLPLKRSDETPLIVIEGLDGSGKTTLTEFLRKKFNMLLLDTPPQYIRTINGTNIRQFFDTQSETVRRAYYGLGNYLASQAVLESNQPVVMDRFWHSTTAYAFANFLKSDPDAGDLSYANEDLCWPSDLLQPNIVIFLSLSEEERLNRHTNRHNFTNTVEEQTLASDGKFRENLKNCYKTISGVRFEEFNVDTPRNVTCGNLMKFVSNLYPTLKIQQ